LSDHEDLDVDAIFGEVFDLILEFFSTWAIVNGGSVFLSPMVSFSFIGSISGFKMVTFNFKAYFWVIGIKKMDDWVSFTSPHGFSGLVVNVFDGSIADTV
jgi:hypothetical protein